MTAQPPGGAQDPILEWWDGQPRSRRFGDVYFSSAGGVDESRHVFLHGNRLPERFAALAGGDAFVVGETGFGTGLNFLCTWELFRQCAHAGSRLHFVSTELYPLPRAELAEALAGFEQLATLRAALLAQYGELSEGWHRLNFDAGRVCLTLLVGDARETLRSLQARVDAWFLDGFSPACNPELWEEPLLRLLAGRSRAGATVATYSSAGSVRRGLAAAGFAVRKAPGYGPKREMVCAVLESGGRVPRAAPARRAAIIGAGLAGAAAARSLADRGWQVDLLERASTPAAGASGNPVGVLYARLSGRGTPLTEVVLAGYQHSLRCLRALLTCDGTAWSDCPVLQLASDEREARRHAGTADLRCPRALLHEVDAREASEIAGMPLRSPALCFPGGGWVHPPALVAALTDHPGIALRTGGDVAGLARCTDSWQLLSADGSTMQVPVVIVAAGAECTRFEQLARLPLRVNRGQITLAPVTPRSARLKAVLCGHSYATPARAGLHTFGATLERTAFAGYRASDASENLRRLAELAPELYSALDGEHLDPAGLGGRAGLRCTSPDYLPMVGPVSTSGSIDGLYVSAAHGSRGLITAPLAGEVLAAILEDEPAPLPAHLMAGIHPGRFAAA